MIAKASTPDSLNRVPKVRRSECSTESSGILKRQSIETDLLIQAENLAGLAAINRNLILKTEALDSPQRVVLDMDAAGTR
jgi:hypothetical protein